MKKIIFTFALSMSGIIPTFASAGADKGGHWETGSSSGGGFILLLVLVYFITNNK